MRIQILLSLFFSLSIPSQDSDLAAYIPVNLKTPSGSESSEIKIFIPTRGELSLDTADKVFDNVVTTVCPLPDHYLTLIDHSLTMS